ncbi:MAG: phosphomannomutase/phosphoglucomutase, partial [Clostridia bacterium]
MDDGMYLVTRLIIEAMRRKREDQTLSTLLDGLQEPVESVEIRLQITAEDFQTAGHDAIDQVLAHTTDEPAWHVAKDNREGVRI